MKKIITIVLFLSVYTSVCYSQEQNVKVKKDLVSVNEIPAFNMISTNYPDAYTLYNFENEKLAIFNALFYNDPKQVTDGNPQGRIGYFDITFFNGDLDKCEIKIVGFKKQLAELIVQEGLIQEGKLNETAVRQFCRVNGTKFSESQKNGNTTIIINH